MNILVKWATRERPEIFAANFPKWDNGRVGFLISLDETDPTLDRYLAVIPAHARVIVDQKPAGKHRAMNLGVAEFSWDICILAQDDSRPVSPDYDLLIAAEFEKHGLDRVLYSHDGYRSDDLNTQPIMGREYFNRFGYIYHEAYKGVWADNEFTEVSRRLGKEIRIAAPLIAHDWIGHNHGGDRLLKHNESFFHADRETFNKRKAAGFP